jgi:hypothetical protein
MRGAREHEHAIATDGAPATAPPADEALELLRDIRDSLARLAERQGAKA